MSPDTEMASILFSPVEVPMPMGEKIQTLRTSKGWSQEDLAKKLGTTAPNVSRWENNHGIPSVDSLKDLSKLFEVSVDYFIFENTPPRPTVGFHDPELAEQFTQIDQLDEPSRAAVKRIIKALANEKKMRELLSPTV
jgi:transcriptional regulator with XRE-family HTH domain